jgi:hypothetical protein
MSEKAEEMSFFGNNRIRKCRGDIHGREDRARNGRDKHLQL